MVGQTARSAATLLLCLTAFTAQITTKVSAARIGRRTASTELGEFLQLAEASGPLRTARQAGSAVLECEFMGSPPPSVQWLRGKALQTQDRPSEKIAELRSGLASGAPSLFLDEPTSIAATRSRLYLGCLSQADQGEYTCQGRGASELASSTTELFVTEPASRESVLACEEAKGSPLQPARVLQWRPKILAMMGSQVRLVCTAAGFPAPSISWTKNYHPLETGTGRITVTASGDLVIGNLQWSDMGQYQCIASNQLASDSVNTFLYPFKASK